MLLHVSVHVTSVLLLVWFNNLTGLQASIGVAHSYSSRPFLCTLGIALDHELYNYSSYRKYAVYLKYVLISFRKLVEILEFILLGPRPLQRNTAREGGRG